MISLNIKTLIDNGRNKETNNLKEFLKQVVSEIDSEVRNLLQDNDYSYSRVTDDISVKLVHKELSNRYESLIRRLVIAKKNNKNINFRVKNNGVVYKVDNALLSSFGIDNFLLNLEIQKHPYNIEHMKIDLQNYSKSMNIEPTFSIHVQ
ncbi:hypothetical protein Alsa1_CDS0113 [Staphylococcus phage Alsa_1]|nr:hypothetical protein Alsa1_CDS0113 [Staphylococcus phage Alsa_1]WNM51055.1 hypothetical protein Alsa3_CDS0186 [Staphylococcus phage Alsa_3]WNM51311.1 hypothetical protein Alsa4_CDS0181 [Staphylococcus phage Alsa_4]